MLEDLRPVFPWVPADFAGGVDFDRHNLADSAALDENNRAANAAIAAASLFSTFDVSCNKRIS